MKSVSALITYNSCGDGLSAHEPKNCEILGVYFPGTTWRFVSDNCEDDGLLSHVNLLLFFNPPPPDMRTHGLQVLFVLAVFFFCSFFHLTFVLAADFVSTFK